MMFKVHSKKIRLRKKMEKKYDRKFRGKKKDMKKNNYKILQLTRIKTKVKLWKQKSQ